MSKMTRENCMFLYPNRKVITSAATSTNCIAKAKMSLFLLCCEHSGYVSKLIIILTDLVKNNFRPWVFSSAFKHHFQKLPVLQMNVRSINRAENRITLRTFSLMFCSSARMQEG